MFGAGALVLEEWDAVWEWMRSIPQQRVQPAKHPGWAPTASETFGQREVLKMSKLAGIPVQKLY